MTGPTAFEFAREGRSWATLGAVVLTWSLCLFAFVILDAAGWIVALALIFTLPGIWDLYHATRAGTRLDDQALSWFSGAQEVRVPLQDIDHIRLVTRIDFSVRAAVVLRSGRKLRLPPEATAPAEAFEAALKERAVKTQRHHFSPL